MDGGGGIINSIKPMDAGHLMRMQRLREGLRVLRDEKRVTVTDSRKKDSSKHTQTRMNNASYW